MNKFINNFNKNLELEFQIDFKSINLYFFFSRLNIYHKQDKLIESYEYIFDDNSKIIKENDKTYLKSKNRIDLFPLDHNAKITISQENICNYNKEIDKNIKLYRYKDRISKYSLLYPNWKFDFTRQIQSKSLNELNKLLNKKKFEYQLEIELINQNISKNDLKNELNMIIKFYYDYLLLFNLQNKLKIRDANNIIQLTNNPIGLDKKNFNNILKDYCVSEKADGERCILYINKNGDILPIFKPFIIKESVGKSKFPDTLLDCEYLDKLNKYMIFDILIFKNELTIYKNFDERYKLLNSFIQDNIDKKIFYFPDNNSIQTLSKNIYSKKYDYYIDGLIYNPINQPYYKGIIYKWKPIEDLTVDFLIRYVTNDKINLYVNISQNLFRKLRLKFDKNYSKFFPFINDKSENFPILFDQITLNDKSNLTLEDNTIIEFSYKNGWKPYRLREDKTIGYLENFKQNIYQGQTGPNGWNTAQSTLESIKDPLTKEMVFGEMKGGLIPDIDFIKVKGGFFGGNYYKETKISKSDDINLYRYNNFIKSYLYDKYLKKDDKLMEIAGGRGGDLGKIDKKNPQFVFFTNIDNFALNEAKRRSKIKNINFLQIDYLNKNAFDKLKTEIKDIKFDLISCQFAFHYFMKNKQTIQNIYQIINYFLKINGYFMFTSYDGEMIHNSKKNIFKSNEKIFAKINKLYQNDFKNYGQEINVYIDKIGLKHKEFLVNFKYIKNIFKNFKVIEENTFSFKINEFKNYLSNDEKEYIELHKFIVLQRYA